MAKKFYLAPANSSSIAGYAGVEFTVQEGGVCIRLRAADPALQPQFDKSANRPVRLEDARLFWTAMVRGGFVRVPAL